MTVLDWKKARLARQAERRQQLAKLAGTATVTRQAQSWDSRISKRPKLSVHNASSEAIRTVREIMNQIQLPGSLKLTYSGLRRTARGWDQTEIQDGVITVSGHYKTTTGNNVYFDVPVEVRQGELLEPSVFFHDGNMKVLASSSFAELTKDRTAYEDQPPRAMYSAPFTDGELKNVHRPHMPTRRPGIFENQAMKEGLRRAIKVRGRDVAVEHKVAGVPDWVKKLQDKHGDGEKEEKKEAQTFVDTLPDHAQLLLTYKTMMPAVAPKGFETVEGEGTGQLIVLCTVADTEACDRAVHAVNTGAQLLKTEKYDDPDYMAPGIPDDVTEPEAAKQAFLYRAPGGESVHPHINAHDDDFLDPAERDRSKYFKPGQTVAVQKELMAMDRGGVRQHIPKGEKGLVIRDMAGDGKEIYIQFENGLKAVVQQHFLKSASREAALSENDIMNQIRQEITSLKESGMMPADIDMAIHQRYPAQADQALSKQAIDRFREPDPDPEIPDWMYETAEDEWMQVLQADYGFKSIEEAMAGMPSFSMGKTYDQVHDDFVNDYIQSQMEALGDDYQERDDDPYP